MKIALPLAALVLGVSLCAAASAEDTSLPLPVMHVQWSFDGPFGTYDRAALQRGFQVYKEVCSTCHSLDLVAFNDLAAPGGPGFTEAQAKAIAAGYKIPAGPNDKGETVDANGNRLTRPGILADHFPAPFPNEQAARANFGGALPPDLSLIVKARAGGADYIYSILMGFGQKPPKGFKVLDGKYYNPYFAGRNISMPPPLTDGSVTFSDGTPSTVANEAKSVVTFLAWASEPKLEQRHRLGLEVMAFLVLLSGLLFLSYRRIWKDEH
ncbi:MAG: cytochrome c1 [Alphaproteobacteria bacterium]|nr:cytochrome c1 [Alphaproteobacteria bacterium]MDE2110010.1 cytochrome c1 [Alphaproteobacteria bacterium]MDE2494929.1 cytochrome c1 [Alphaproteobacteria bacterium]